MNIVFLSPEYPLWASGGIGTFLQTYGRALVKEGHRVTILGPGVKRKEVELQDQGVRLIRLAANAKKWLPNFMHNAWQINKKLKALHNEHPIDIIEASELGLALLSRKHPAKKVIRLHGGHHFFSEAENRGINWRRGWLEKKSFTKADGFIAVSDYVRTHTAKYLSYQTAKIETIAFPINTDRPLLELPVNDNRLLFAGTICEKKGVRQLIQAFAIVRKSYPSLHLDIFGREWFYPDGASYTEEIQNELEAKLFENVHFEGEVSREVLDTKYAQARMCIFPSHMETQGLVSLEAMLLQKPVIFSKYGPGPETIEHGVTGLLCDVYDPEDIAKQILWCIENPKKAQELGVNGRQFVLKKYKLETALTNNLEFYKSL